MLLVIDVGNTHITLGVFEEKELKGTFRMTTGYSRTSDEYGIFICNMLEYRGINKDLVDAAIISSVVPDVMHSLTSGIIKYFHIKPYHVKWDSFTGITVKTANPKALGADRIVDAAAAYEIYGGPVLIADFGTATTYDLVNEKGRVYSGDHFSGTGDQRKGSLAAGGEASKVCHRKTGIHTGQRHYYPVCRRDWSTVISAR